MKRPIKIARGAIRPCALSDLPQVAEMYRRVFLNGDPALLRSYSTQAVQTALTEIFFGNPWYDEEISSLVYAASDGAVIGFLGVTARRMLFRERPIRAAVSSHLMTEPARQSQLAGLQLLKSFFDGPQEFSLTDGATDAGRKLWEGLGGITVPGYGFHWQRVLQPSKFMRTSVSKKFPLLSSFNLITGPLCRIGDFYLRRQMPDRFQISNVKDKAENPGLETLVTGLSEIAPSSLQPDYDEAELGWLLRQANRVKHAGVLQKVAVRNVKQELQGWFIYYLQPNGESKVLQLVARRNTLDEVFDYLCQHALQGGAISLGGRVEPKHLPMLAAHHCFFTSGTPWFQVHSRNRDLLQAILCGDALLTKLDGEWCTSFRGE